MNVIDLSKTPLREVNSRLQKLPKDTNERLWKLMAEVWPAYDDYQARTDREIPVVVLSRR